jgi:hypothetical protein
LIREYEDTDAARLPDERYQIRLRYYDTAQLIEERKAYDVQMKSFETEVQHLWDVLHVIYEDSKSFFKITDFNDLAKKEKNRIRKVFKEKTGEPLYEEIAKVWDEISFVKTGETEVEKMNRTYVYEKDKIRQKLILMRDKMKAMYDYQYPVERRVMEDRINFLEKEYYRFEYMLNPYHIQPGLLLDVDITSIKRKKATLDSMANVLNEFLSGVSKGFADAAFASFSRRRSTVREDINQTFGGGEETAADKPVIAAGPGQAYLDMLNTSDSSSTAALPAPRPKAAAKPAAKPAAKAQAGASRSKGGKDALKEI